MEKTGGSIEIGNTKEMYFTYSEEEKQEIEIAKANSKVLFTPEFIPYYIKDIKILKLTPLEGIIYGYIRFYLSNCSERFYFSSEDLSEILDCAVGTIDNIFTKLSKLGVIETGRRVKAGGGTIRFVNKFIGIPTSLVDEVDNKKGSDLIGGGGLTSLVDEVHINNNNINNNNSSFFSGEKKEFVTKPKKTSTNQPPHNHLVNENEPGGFVIDGSHDKPKTSPKGELLSLGDLENVKLTQEQYNSLVKDYSKDLIEEYISRLSLRIPNSKRPVKSASATIRSWLLQKGIKKNNNKHFTKMTDDEFRKYVSDMLPSKFISKYREDIIKIRDTDEKLFTRLQKIYKEEEQKECTKRTLDILNSNI